MGHAVRGAREFDTDAGCEWWRWDDRIVIVIPAAGDQRQQERQGKKSTTLHEDAFCGRNRVDDRHDEVKLNVTLTLKQLQSSL